MKDDVECATWEKEVLFGRSHVCNLLSLRWRAAKRAPASRTNVSAVPQRHSTHNWRCCGRAPVLPTTQTSGCLSPQGLQDYTGHPGGSVTVTETSLGCQLSPLCPCRDTPSVQQRPPLPLTSVLEPESFFPTETLCSGHFALAKKLEQKFKYDTFSPW